MRRRLIRWLGLLLAFEQCIRVDCADFDEEQHHLHQSSFESAGPTAEKYVVSHGNLRVAMCFVGQFLRGASGGKEAIGLRQRFAAGFGEGAIYDAFVATSNQHFEEQPDGPQVNASTLCRNLQSPFGPFARCEVSTTPYHSGTKHLKAAQGLPFMTSNGLYPHRVASFFSSISKCLDLVHNATSISAFRSHAQRTLQIYSTPTDEPVMSSISDSLAAMPYSNNSEAIEFLPNLTLPAESSYQPFSPQSSSSIYDVVIVTRLDLLSHLMMRPKLNTFFRGTRLHGPGRPKNAKNNGNVNWEQTLVAGGQNHRRCEDRLFFGPPKLLLQLRFLARDIPHLFAPFQTNDRINTNSSRKDIVIRSNRTSKRSARHNGASRAETSKSRHSRSSHRSLGARTDNRSSINSNNVLFNQNGGRNTKSKTFTRALMLAHLKPAKTFSPETLLYEYISAIAAHRRANILDVGTYAAITGFSQWKQKYGPAFGSYLAQQLNVSEESFIRRSCRELKNPGAVSGCMKAQAMERKVANAIDPIGGTKSVKGQRYFKNTTRTN